MAEVALDTTVSAEARYTKLEMDRQGFLTRARDCAKLTIPAILPPQGFSATSQLPTPYQSLGARGARNLASKLNLSLFPAIPFFNYRIDDRTLAELGAKRGEMEDALSSRERSVALELDTCVFRPASFLVTLHLIVTGNVIVRVPRDQEAKAQVFRLDQYVVRRDAAGKLLEFIIQEKTDLNSLPEAIRPTVVASMTTGAEEGTLTLEDRPVALYTHGYWDPKAAKWVVYQEAAKVRIPGTEGTYKPDELEYLVLRFSYQPGEHYGRSYVEEYLGDLDSLEALSETLVEGSAASARIVFLVRPGGVTQLKVVAEARNGAVVSGDAEDVSTLQAQKQADLQVAKAQAEEIAARLSYAFLLHSSIQRTGERVTAEEIRYMASELDDALGGVYTLLAAEYQLPAVRLFELRMEKRLGVQKLPSDLVRPVVVTGLDAIGRGHDQKNLRAFVQEIIATLGPEIAMKFINIVELIKRAAASYGIDTKDLLKSEEQIAQEQQQQMMLALASQGVGPAVNQLGGMGNTMLKAQQGQPTQ
jgi:hypothetical protein